MLDVPANRYWGAQTQRSLIQCSIGDDTAHFDEIVDPSDFGRYQSLDAIPVLSFQWEKPAPDTIDGAQAYLGPARFRYIEPAGYLKAAGARIAYGSDWPVDPLDEWFALKVGVTRTAATAISTRRSRARWEAAWSCWAGARTAASSPSRSAFPRSRPSTVLMRPAIPAAASR